MYIFQYVFMCLYIGLYLYFQLTNTPLPDFMREVNVWTSRAFLLWGGYVSVKVIADCIMLNAKSQMTADSMRNGILLATLNFLPTLLMSLFMLREGFAGN